ncbi:hypothetical protein J7E87_27300 [Streptomyces sp. ISL-1]|uniref:hypothetical protein n=1 Tax=Streptomyces sp. ISL-1 TaxID=2817657 RepID=UPI001BEC33C5|nr:hypothetical protein [Streptomyces sp. ISL-1]MBT2393042.1 hypothetical protein [Streptomyces sp. ISL-1]
MFGAGNQNGRQRAAVAALVGVVLSGAAACGGSDDEGDRGGKGGKGGGKPPASASAPKALAEAQLRAVSFTDGEKIGPYTASEFTLGAPLGEDYTAAPAVCQPLVSLAEGATAHDPAAEVNRQLDIADEIAGIGVAVQLRSYANGEAAAVMKALAAAGTQCAGGFVEERAVAKAKYLKAEPAKAPAFGDEAKAYRFTILDVKGKLKLYEYLTVVRSGSTTLSFRADFLGTKDIGAVPAEVMTAQWEKFEAGGKTGA